MPTLWLFDIEPHEQRYTSEWKVFLPRQLRKAMRQAKHKGWNLKVVNGGKVAGSTSSGGFLNFAETNRYKSKQVELFARHIANNDVRSGDRLLFSDGWHPGIVNCKYMTDLHGLDVSVDLMMHAGSYDRHDFLGRNHRMQNWAK